MKLVNVKPNYPISPNRCYNLPMSSPRPPSASLDVLIQVRAASPAPAGDYGVFLSCVSPAYHTQTTLPFPLVEAIRQQSAPLNQGTGLTRSQLVTLGELTFQALWNGTSRDIYRDLQARLVERQRLRILLDLPRELRQIPWELMFDPWRNQFVGYGDNVTLLRLASGRTTPGEALAPSGRADTGLVILAVTAEASDLPALDATAEVDIIRALLQSEAPGSNIRLASAPATETGLRQGLAQDPDILHFIGHGGINEGRPGIYLTGANGAGQFTPPDIFKARFLAGEGLPRRLRLAVLNACQTSETPSQTAGYASFASELLPEIPSVVAMLCPIENECARTFSQAFYRQLAAGATLDEALYAGRQSIYHPEGTDWLAPVLVSTGDEFRLRTRWTPFKGPVAYTRADQDGFFGRDQELASLLELIEEHAVSLLSGPSACGKTSLVQAGLLPNASRTRRVISLPVEAELHRRLRSEINRQLQASGQAGLPEGDLLAALHSLNDQWLIVLDRLEQSEFLGEEDQQVLEALARWAMESTADPQRAGRLLLVARLERDETGQEPGLEGLPGEWHSLVTRFSPGHLPIRSLERGAMSRMITAATRNAAVQFTEPLVEAILAGLDYETEANMLQVQAVCQGIYEFADRKNRSPVYPELLHDPELGGIEAILGRRLDPAQKLASGSYPDGELARRLLAQLVRVGSQPGQFSLRRVSEEVLALRTPAPEALRARTLDQLVEDGLVTYITAEGQRLYELVHEALVGDIAPWLAPDEVEVRRLEQILEGASGGWLLRPASLAALTPHRNRLALTREQQILVLHSALESGEGLDEWITTIAERSARFAALSGEALSPHARLAAAPWLGELARGDDEPARLARGYLLHQAQEGHPLLQRAAAQAVAATITPAELATTLNGPGQVPSPQAIPALAYIYDLSGKLPPHLAGGIRRQILLTLLRLTMAEWGPAAVRRGLWGGLGFLLLAEYNWFWNDLTYRPTPPLLAATLPIGLMVLFLTFPGMALPALGQNLAALLSGGRKLWAAASGRLAGGMVGGALSLFLLSGLAQMGMDQATFDLRPTLVGAICGGAIALGSLVEILQARLPFGRKLPWGLAGATFLGAAGWAIPASWGWIPPQYDLLSSVFSPAVLGNPYVLPGALLGLLAAIGLRLHPAH